MKIIATVEMPKGSSYKYEIKNGTLVLDRVINRQVPFNYGFIHQTLAEDKDALDVFLVSHEPIQPGAKVTAEVVGGFDCVDNGVSDEKIVAVVGGESFPFMFEFIEHYLKTYKEGFVVLKSLDASESAKLVDKYTLPYQW